MFSASPSTRDPPVLSLSDPRAARLHRAVHELTALLPSRRSQSYNDSMSKRGAENLNVTCPCCQAKLVVDPVFGAVLSHEAPPKKGPDVDLTQASSILEAQQRQREDKFADSWFQETNKEDILAKKFEEAMKKAKDAPAGKPIRDFDLD